LYADDDQCDDDDGGADVFGVLLPPRLEVVEFFLFFEIVDCHRGS